jgi:predicted flavoprotein YhiN
METKVWIIGAGLAGLMAAIFSAEATVTRGGVSLAETESKTMESKICPGLFFAGEVLDLDGPCGGYNLQLCWSIGALAGSQSRVRI